MQPKPRGLVVATILLLAGSAVIAGATARSTGTAREGSSSLASGDESFYSYFKRLEAANLIVSVRLVQYVDPNNEKNIVVTNSDSLSKQMVLTPGGVEFKSTTPGTDTHFFVSFGNILFVKRSNSGELDVVVPSPAP
jgi:hypothetical protein